MYAALRPETSVEVHAKQTVASVGYNRFGREDVARRFAEVVHEDLPHSVASDALASFSQSPFHGTWVLNQDATPLPEKPAQYSLNKGIFRCSGCIVNTEVQADGYDHKVPPADYWDTVKVQIVDTHTIEIIAKKAGKTILTEVDAISAEGSC